jgi:hypothetical protein
MYKHYIRPDANGIIIKGFTSAFLKESEGNEEILPGDLELQGYDARQFEIPLTVYRDGGTQFKYKVVDGQMIERTQAELDAEWAARPPAPKTELEIMKESAAQQSADFQAFMDDYYSKNPE